MNDTSFCIREYSEDDKLAVIDVVGKTLVGEKVIPSSELPIDDADLQNIFEYYSGKSRFWVAEQAGKVIGTIALKDNGVGIGKLRRMFVLHALHGSGVGQKLLDTALSYAKNNRFIKIILNTHANMKRAHRFYEKNGFILVEKGSSITCPYRYEKSLVTV